MARKIKLNRRVAAITPSATLGIDAKAKEMAAAGRNVLSFAAGEPDFDTPAPIRRAAAEALEKGQTRYAPATGLASLKTAIAAKLRAENGLEYAPDQIVVSNGAKHSLFNLFMALCRRGDEVIIPSPFWLSYPEMVSVAGGRPVFVPCREANDFKMTAEEFEAAITPKTKAVILNSPSNPVGNVYLEHELRALAEVAVRRGVVIVADEIYEKMVYGGVRHVSIGSFSRDAYELTVTVNGFSKAFAMTGWRLGYAAGPADLMKVIGALQSHSTSGPNTFAMFGAVAALKGPADSVRDMVRAFEERSVYIHRRLEAMPGITCVKPQGAFYVLPNIASFGLGSMEFTDRLLEAEAMAVVPGLPFGSDRHVRLSYACSMEQIRDGMDRLERFVKSL